MNWNGNIRTVIDWFRHPVSALVVRLLIGALMLYAGMSKITDLPGMAESIENYRLLPTASVNIVAMILPGVEIVTGLFLMAGFMLRGSVYVTVLLMLFFLGGISWAIWHGLDIECGCFGTSDAEKVGWSVFARDFIFLLLMSPLLVTPRNLLSLDQVVFGKS